MNKKRKEVSGEPHAYLQEEASKSRNRQSEDLKAEACVVRSRSCKEGRVSKGKRAVGWG